MNINVKIEKSQCVFFVIFVELVDENFFADDADNLTFEFFFKHICKRFCVYFASIKHTNFQNFP